GKKIPVEGDLRIIAHEGGYAGLAVLHDITDRMKFEEERNVLLQQIERNLGELSILNDGIRNPLTIMMILAEETDSLLNKRFVSQIDAINEMVHNLDKRWVESEKVLRFLRRHYDIGRYVPGAPGCRPDRDP
ncbi:MAG: hypothetical protein LUQ50_03280, partial [Methanospirillum sp.]|nr:hypothetical protein [Methanospirillum sp.]